MVLVVTGAVASLREVVMQEQCLFCAIGSGAIPSEVLWQDDEMMAFGDISPQAPVHVLLIPKRHFPNIAALVAVRPALASGLLAAAAAVAAQLGVAGGGYRLVMNTGAQGGQTVEHVHVHLLGGRQLGWPPG